MKIRFIISFIFLFFFNISLPQNKYKALCVAFYNLENLFDTINSPGTRDGEFTPGGSKNWNTRKYRKKLNNLSQIISDIGRDISRNAPVIIGVCEVENRTVLEDLTKVLKRRHLNYKIIHYDSPDVRGIDIALLYNPYIFKVIRSKTFTIDLPGEHSFTRDILLVTAYIEDEEFHIIVNHWPSRRGGVFKTEPLRIVAAQTCRKIVDSLFNINPEANIIIMGDFNDNPTDKSIKTYLKAKTSMDDINGTGLFNTMAEKYKRGIGTVAYKGVWGLFDQMIVSKNLLTEKKNHYCFYKSFIYKKDFLVHQEGRFKGYPKRTFVGNRYLAGYSDHFPVYLILIKNF